MRKLHCPTCDRNNDVHTEIYGEDVEPVPGDIVICAYCAYAGIINEDNASVRDLTQDEWAELPLEIKRQLTFALLTFNRLRETAK